MTVFDHQHAGANGNRDDATEPLNTPDNNNGPTLVPAKVISAEIDEEAHSSNTAAPDSVPMSGRAVGMQVGGWRR